MFRSSAFQKRTYFQKELVEDIGASSGNAIGNPDQSFQLILDGGSLIFSANVSFQTSFLGEGGKYGRK